MRILRDPLFFVREYLLYMLKDPLTISLILSSSIVAILIGAVLFGFINPPGHCGATDPRDIDWYYDAGTDY